MKAWNPVLYSVVVLFGCQPEIDSVFPTVATRGAQITVQGSRLAGDAVPEISLAGVVQTEVNVESDEEVTFTLSADAVSGRVLLTNSRGSDLSTDYIDVLTLPGLQNEGYTFGTLDGVFYSAVEPVGLDQPVLAALGRARWAPNTGDFSVHSPLVDQALQHISDFWQEASYDKVSFSHAFAGSKIYSLPMSSAWYYRRRAQRAIRSVVMAEPIVLSDPVTLTLRSDGTEVNADISAGSFSRSEIIDFVNDAIDAIPDSMPQPTVTFGLSSNRFRASSSLSDLQPGRLELDGSAVPRLGFVEWSLHEETASKPYIIHYGRPLFRGLVFFPVAQTLSIETDGLITNVDFPQGEISMDDVLTAINDAKQSEDDQRPFDVELVDNPLDPDQAFLVFSTHLDNDLSQGEHGYRLVISGTAMATLGIEGFGTVRRYRSDIYRRNALIRQAFEAYLEDAANSTEALESLESARIFVTFLVDDNSLRANASVNETITIGDQQYEAGTFVARDDGKVADTFAHEAGHNLGLPDLYKEDGSELGNAPNMYDIMATSRNAHPLGWLKSRHHKAATTQAEQWMSDNDVLTCGPPGSLECSPPAADELITHTVILTPQESPWPTENPFEADHPGVPVVHGVELIPTDPRDVIWIENRQRGPYQADHLGDPVDYSTMLLPGVIAYMGRRLSPNPLNLLPASMITLGSPLSVAGDSIEHPLTISNRVTLSVLEVLSNPDINAGPNSFSYLTEVKWGTGSFFDLALTPWGAPPWESVDIWVDNEVENDLGQYSYEDNAGNPIMNGDNIAIGQDNFLHARIHNLGDIDVTDDVTVIWRMEHPQLAGGHLQGPELGRVVVNGVPARSSVVTPGLKFRPQDNNEGHVCVSAEIVSIPGERNETLNNSAQENLTQWFSRDGSPFESIEFVAATKNPFDNRTLQIRLDVPKVPQGWTVEVEQVGFELLPEASLEQTVRIKPIKQILLKNTGPRKHIEPFIANIEAKTILKDNWVTIGGLTAVVHPVNHDSRLTLGRGFKTDSDGNPVLGAVLETNGDQAPVMSNLTLNLKLSDQEGNRHWVRTNTDGWGRAEFLIPSSLHGKTLLMQAYYSGGRGIAPTHSDEVTGVVPEL